GTNYSDQACVTVQVAPASHIRYQLVDLGPLETNASTGFGLNGLGHFVGDFPTLGSEDRPFLDIGGILTLLTSAPLLPGYATAINNSDAVLINANGNGYLWQHGQATNVGSLGSSPTYVRAINSAGLIVGNSQRSDGHSHAFLFDGQTMADLGALPGGSVSQANAISDSGLIAGSSQNSTGQSAFLYDALHGMQAVANPSGMSVGEAWGVNNSSNIVGDAFENANNVLHAFVRINGATRDLGSLGGFSAYSYANAINNSNQVVGVCQMPNDDDHGFLWQTNVLFDLNQLIPTNSNWTITAGNAINDAGQILAQGRFGSSNLTEHAVLLNPIPAPGQPVQFPVVALVAPTNNTVAASGTSIALAAEAGAQDASVTNVSFYAGTQFLGATTNPPFLFTWSNAPAGSYQLSAVAVDNFGATQTSAPVMLTLKSAVASAPRIAILGAASPAENADVQNKLVGTIM